MARCQWIPSPAVGISACGRMSSLLAEERLRLAAEQQLRIECSRRSDDFPGTTHNRVRDARRVAAIPRKRLGICCSDERLRDVSPTLVEE
jgi:hypothetical protein